MKCPKNKTCPKQLSNSLLLKTEKLCTRCDKNKSDKKKSKKLMCVYVVKSGLETVGIFDKEGLNKYIGDVKKKQEWGKCYTVDDNGVIKFWHKRKVCDTETTITSHPMNKISYGRFVNIRFKKM